MRYTPVMSHYYRLSLLPPQSLRALLHVVGEVVIPLPRWITPTLITRMIDGDSTPADGPTIERIFMVRQVVGHSVEFLAKFSTSPFCRWLSEEILISHSTFPAQLALFHESPQEFELLSAYRGSLLAIARRGDEYLFKIDAPSCACVYWDVPSTVFEASIAAQFDHFTTTVQCTIPPARTDIPDFACTDLAPFQSDGVNWLVSLWRQGHARCILGDDAGMGKSVQFIRLCQHLRQHACWGGPFLVLALHVGDVLVWNEEFQHNKKFAVLMYEGPPDMCDILREHAFTTSRTSESVNFDVLLTTYDIFARDIAHLQSIPFHIMCCDNPPCFADSADTTADLLRQFAVPFTVVLADGVGGTDVDTVSRLVAFARPSLCPDWLANPAADVSDVVLYRSADTLGPGFAAAQQLVAFITPTPIQLMLLRLAARQQLEQFLGAGEAGWPARETATRQICNHPLLVPGFENALAPPLRSDDTMRLIGTSAKFVCLDRCLSALQRQRRPTLIVTQFPGLLQLVGDFCKLKLYSFAILSDDISASEREQTIRYLHTDPAALILLVSAPLRRGEIPPGAVVFLLDADVDLAQAAIAPAPVFVRGDARDRMLVFHVVVYGTTDHIDYVQSHRESFFLRKRLSSDVAQPDFELTSPPDLALIAGEPPEDFQAAMHEIAHVVPAGAFEAIARASFCEIHLAIGDSKWVETVTKAYLGNAGNQKGTTPTDPTLDETLCRRLLALLRQFGFGGWTAITRQLPMYSVRRVFQLASVLVVIAFRALNQSLVPFCPILSYRIRKAVPEVSLSTLICSSPNAIATFFRKGHPFEGELMQLRPFAEIIADEAEPLLVALEVRLLFRVWSKHFGKSNFLFDHLPPPRDRQIDRAAFAVLVEYRDINIGSSRLTAIVELMLFDLISETRPGKYTRELTWWSQAEVSNIICVLRSYGLDMLSGASMHAKAGLIAKTEVEVVRFLGGMRSVIDDGGGSIEAFAKLTTAPHSFRLRDHSWTVVDAKLVSQVELASRVMLLISKALKLPEIEVPVGWKMADMWRLLAALRNSGISRFSGLFEDQHLGLPKTDRMGTCLENVTELARYLEHICR
jgi:hypothetical protein